MPHIIIVDPEGIVRFVTNGMEMTADKIRKLVNGEEVYFYPKARIRPGYDISKFPGSENNTLVYRSILTRSSGERSAATRLIDYIKDPIEYRRDGIAAMSMPLRSLYLMAYYGGTQWTASVHNDGLYFYPDVILEIEDKSLFEYDYNPPEFKGLYCFNLAVHPSKSDDLEYIKKIFQRELKNVFGYEASMERRMLPAWKLIAQPGAAKSLKTKNGQRYIGDGTGSGAMPTGFKALNIASKEFLDLITYYISGNQPPFLDCTGFTHNIDLSFNADMVNRNSIKSELQRKGLDLILEDNEFWVLVIRDGK